MFLFMIMLIWDNVVVVENDIEMRWHWCWDDVDVDADNDIEMRCWKCHCDDVWCVCTWGIDVPSFSSIF